MEQFIHIFYNTLAVFAGIIVGMFILQVIADIVDRITNKKKKRENK